MTSNLVTRLLHWSRADDLDVGKEAADEIQRLENEIADLKDRLSMPPAPETAAEPDMTATDVFNAGVTMAAYRYHYKAALERIARWFGEFPPTGRTWDDGSPMSYAACFGSNGERDYMRAVAQEALDSEPPPPKTGCSDE